MDYVDLTIRLGAGAVENIYSVSAHSVQTGKVTGSFVLPVTPDELEHFVVSMGARSRGARGAGSPEWQASKTFGAKLFNAVFDGKIHDAYLTALNSAQRQRLGLRLKLILDAPALADYPWEFLYDAPNAQFPALFENTPLVRFIELPEAIPPLAVTPPLRILAGIASPRDYETLDTEHERYNLAQALAPVLANGQIILDWFPHLTLETLRQQLLTNEYHIFHFIGHGGFDAEKQDGLLVFEGEQGHSHPVSGEQIAIVLGNHRSLRLAVLNACEGARTSPQDPFAGTATTLIRTGDLPAVVAMQFAISDTAAINFAGGFYNALASGRPIDAAVAQGRQAIFTSSNDTEWATPVLYLRAPDGKIFAVQAQTDMPMPAAPPAAMPTSLPERRAPTRVRAAVPFASQKKSSPSILRVIVFLMLLCVLIPAIGYIIQNFFGDSKNVAPAASSISVAVPTRTVVIQTTQNNTDARAPSVTPLATLAPAIFPTQSATPAPITLTTLNLSDNPGRSENPQILVDAQGVVHVVWQDNTPNPKISTPNILYRQLQNGTWSPAEIIYDGAGNLGVYGLQMLRDTNGQACIRWNNINRVTFLRCHENNAWGKTTQFKGDNTLAFTPDGQVRGIRFYPYNISFENQELGDAFSIATDPYFVIDPRGTYHVVWLRTGKKPYQSVEYRASSDGGKTWSAPQRLSDENSKLVDYPRMLGDAQGNLHLVYKADGRFYYRHWTPAQGWSNAVDIRGTATGGNLIGFAVDAQFKPHVLWTYFGSTYTHQNADGTWSIPQQFTNAAAWTPRASNLAVGADGARYFAWHDNETDDIFFSQLPPE